MEDVFIQSIKVNKARNLVDFDIPLSEKERKHLIITGKNGSGKTSLLEEVRKFLSQISNGQIEQLNSSSQGFEGQKRYLTNLEENEKSNENAIFDAKNAVKNYEDWFATFGGCIIRFTKDFLTSQYYKEGNFILAFFQTKRNVKFEDPKGVFSVKLKPTYNLADIASKDFIQYIVNLKADKSFAKDDNDLKTAQEIDRWFDDFEKSLFSLFDSPNIELNFDRKTYNFNIKEEGKEPYNFNQLSGGYSAILSIVTELILRMEEHRSKSYDVQGVVLIDEIETHLHIDLQKKILPFLTSFFPKIQFIVTTHSPFVLSSIDNAVICDLEKRIVTTDLSGYSYDTLIESYFGSDKYSDFLKEKVNRYETLTEKEELDEEERNELFDIKKYLKDIPKFMSDELAVKLQQIKLKELSKREHA